MFSLTMNITSRGCLFNSPWKIIAKKNLKGQLANVPTQTLYVVHLDNSYLVCV